MKNNFFRSKVWSAKTTTSIITALVVVFIFTWLMPVLAIDTGLQYGTFTGLGTQDIRITVMRIIQIALGLVGIIALVLVIYAGFIWTTSMGNPERIETAKKIMTNAAIGLVIIFLSFSIVSFVIGLLQDALGGTQPTDKPPTVCDGCGHLGTGIIESVYPAPFSRNIARNTNLFVTFKVVMDPKTIMATDQDVCTVAAPCVGALKDNSVLIYKAAAGAAEKIAGADVVVKSNNGRQFMFDPPVLGDGVNNIWYEVKLTDQIKKDNGERAFGGQFGNYFTWSFEIGTLLDIDPVESSGVFPQPDEDPDTYNLGVGQQAVRQITVTDVPGVAQAGTVVVTSGAAENLNFIYQPSGSTSYTGTYVGILTLTVSADQSKLNISTGTTSNDYDIKNGLVDLSAIAKLFIRLSNINPGNQWTLVLTPPQPAATLTISDRTYSFVATNPTANQIQRGTDVATTAINVAAKISADLSSLVTATSADEVITLLATRSGVSGNNIPFSSTGAWLGLASGNLLGGRDPIFSATPIGAPDQPRNAIIKIDFNEAISPIAINAETVKIEYETSPGNWQVASGNYFVSNQYRSVEFLSNQRCGICSNNSQPCTQDSGCGVGNVCNFVANSCGDTLYCLPVLNTPTTHYRVTAKARSLKDCTTGGCQETSYSFCVPTSDPTKSVCANKSPYSAANNFFYPEADALAGGIIDAANNSFNANNNTYVLNNQTLGNAQGPLAQSGKPAYNLNSKDAAASGDDLVWSFYINKQIKLEPPKITQLGPNVNNTGVSLTLPLAATFDSLLFNETLKPGTGYQDGLCGCQNDSNCNSGETCDKSAAAIKIGGIEYGKCRNSDSVSQKFCAQDSSCKTKLCINKKYVTLIDRSSAPAGFWITEAGIDQIPQDGYSDLSRAEIQHSRFVGSQSYGGEIGSGVKDVYQNCYLPSGGPNGVSGRCSGGTVSDCITDIDCNSGYRCEGVLGTTPGTGSCQTTAIKPYCCSGQALTQSQWEISACFTSY